MITVKDIKAFAKANEMEVEEYFPISNVRNGRYLSESNFNYSIGLRVKSGVWFWWQECLLLQDLSNCNVEDFKVMFSERYNQNTGKSIKGFTTGFNMEMKIQDTVELS